ncbi:ParB/RepB/Spo0J family partition protein [Bacteroides gallinaceum]|uniref:ParB/RepB/Spo0J family partition protein n=2 Tax=Bacteroidaceae TaxID=815 RepID=A0ABT7X4U5_9BACE|nr:MULTISPECIES: ParB/RepB/Spo0J family partition protein [Bacteroidaceae]CCZ70671.1 parB-like partition protein [Bacteroides sp. CAG:702]HJD10220.1 ParB/RepB/Spo0J family partition protein [Candidatus Phocaeicola caecigallinarum]MBD8041319.1 ParB/RepB/Spo0J family partition protein [Phocaeicola intestinalis]MBM6658049.1 ParB/RepB/Spo0J family partition protein [Bacteroides gallinaceum]MBM6719958.1 ParB/RepB/Spo0J family partition protein [Bacteroides gallinaceum]
MAVQKKYALGRGLDALISTNEEIKTSGSSSINEIELDKISVNPNQPRREFDPIALQELADSIAEIGIIQPITLRQLNEDSYQIIAGERRYRAAVQAGLKTIPAYIRTADDENVMEMALIENIQREDLNSLEIALAYQHLIEQYGLTQERLSDRVGKKRATIANYLRLLKLPAPIQVALKNKEIDMGHARALLALDDPKTQIRIFNEIISQGYSVRKVEEIVKALSVGESVESGGKKITPKGAKLSEEYTLLQNHLCSFFGTKVQLSCSNKGKGKISIPFNSEADLERIMEILDSLQPKE